MDRNTALRLRLRKIIREHTQQERRSIPRSYTSQDDRVSLRRMIREEMRILREEDEPAALAVLGAPAGGKSYTMNKIKSIANDARITKTMESGVTLTVDKLREEFQSKDPVDQIQGFAGAFYLMRDKAKDNPKEFAKWFDDIKKLWSGKLSKLLPALEVSVSDEELTFGGSPALQSIDKIKPEDAASAIEQLDKYNDYKRVVRYFQTMKQEDAIGKKMNVSYDEAGDEPQKIVNNLQNLHKKGYITDTFLIHPENVASNLIQNFFRVVTGGDGGRDSSGSIIQAFNDIEKSKDIYSDNAEETIKVASSNIDQSSAALKSASVKDDAEKGDKPIDVFVQVEPMPPDEAYNTFTGKLDEEQKEIFKAFLRYAADGIPGMPSNAKESLNSLVSDIDGKKAMEIFKKAAATGKYDFANGGVSEKFLKKASSIFGVDAAANESRMRNAGSDRIIVERWQKLAGILKG